MNPYLDVHSDVHLDVRFIVVIVLGLRNVGHSVGKLTCHAQRSANLELICDLFDLC